MGHKDHISNLIKEATEDFGKISSIKPMVYEGTPICTNQWIVIFEMTEDPDLIKRIPRYTHIWDQKVTLEWKEAPKICFYCNKEGHIKRECEELRKLIEYRQRQKEHRLQVIMQTQVQNQTKIMESVTYSAN